jgi:orotate phosphoribosyltransferase
MLHAAAAASRALDAFVVRKGEKGHGQRRRIERPEVPVGGVFAVGYASTAGGSVLTAVEALRPISAEVTGVAVIVDRGAGQAIRAAGMIYRSAFSLAESA